MAEQTENPRVQSAGGVASGAACMVSRADRILAPNVPTSVIVVGARIARPRREAAFHERCDSCEKPVHTTAPQRPPCVKGPQGSAASGRTSDRSDWAAACLGGPQRGPGRLSGNPDHRPLRLHPATVLAVGAACMAARIRFRFAGGLIQTAAALGRTYNGPYGGDRGAAIQTAFRSRQTLRERPLRGPDAQCAPLRCLGEASA